MVRGFIPQTGNSSILTNEFTPPQHRGGEGGLIPPPIITNETFDNIPNGTGDITFDNTIDGTGIITVAQQVS